jgi:hypothetical protein
MGCRIDFWNSAFGLAASCQLHLPVFSLPTTFLLSLMSAFQHLFNLGQILIFFAVALRMLPIASKQHAASCSTSSAVHFASK